MDVHFGMSPYHFSAMSLVRAAGQIVLEAVAGVSRDQSTPAPEEKAWGRDLQ
jgi:hypothetical protein